MKNEVEYVVEGKTNGMENWRKFVIFKERKPIQSRQWLKQAWADDKQNGVVWSYRILKRTTTVTDEVIE